MPKYGRPFLEIEFDQHALMQPGCCCFVQVVVRLCGIPTTQNVMLTVNFDRVRKYDQDGTALNDYDLHPMRTPIVHKEFPNYQEYAAEFLARAHDQETGTIRITMTSASGSTLSQAEYRLDSRYAKPVQRECRGFLGVCLLPHVRTPQERDAFRGQYAAIVTSNETNAQEQEPSVGSGRDVYMIPLFPLE